MKVGYLGPEGTFSYQAAKKYVMKMTDYELVPFKTITDCLEGVDRRELDYGVVPFENSIEGTVNFTIDSLIFDVDVNIIGDITIPIRHFLAAKPGVVKEDICQIFSHPQPIGQCRKYLAANFHDLPTVPVTSTAESARLVSESEEIWGAICTREAAEKFGLAILEEDIQDENHNETRFLVVTKDKKEPPTFEGKTSIIFGTDDKPGELYKILDIISIWDLNMTKIESRPRKNALGKYVFFIDMESDNAADIRDALNMIERKTNLFKHLGTYRTLY